MKNINWKKILPHVIAVIIFLVVAVIYCKPALEGKVLQQNDVTQWKAMVQNQEVAIQKTGKIPLWTNGMFSGMPAYMIKGNSNNLAPWYFIDIISLHLPRPIQFFFLACVCFYFLSQVLAVRNWIGVVGALCYAYATYNTVIVAEGHETKMISLALLPGLVGSILLIFNKKYWVGLALTALFTASLICQKHYQIIYYSMIIVAGMSISFGIRCLMQKDFKHLALATIFSLLGVAIGAISNAVELLPDNEYTKESIRGGSLLADSTTKNTKEGLSKEYASSYSVYKTEPLVMLIPRMYGGSNKMEVAEDKSQAVVALQEMNQQVAQQLQGNLGFYWGGIGGTSGPPYVGAIICFLALLGFVILDSKHKWWILSICIITIMMSWGSYFEGFNNFLFNNLPLYNKFRAPSMILVVPTFLLNVMAILALQKVLDVEDKKLLFSQYKKALYITGGLFVMLLLLYFNFDYKSEGDTNLLKQIAAIPDENTKAVFMEGGNKLINGLKEDRKALFMGDILRSLFFITVAAGVLWFAITKKLNELLVIAIIGVFAFVDIIIIDTKYLSSDNFQEKEENEVSFKQTPADTYILQDKSDYRIFDVSNGPQAAINYGAKSAYFHKSIGGYHPAKLSIYQDLAEHQLYNYPNCQPVLNMLNTKYIIHSSERADQVESNPNACGSVWLIKGLQKVNSPKEEMDALTTLNVKDTAVIQQSYESITNTNFKFDSTAKIELVKNENDIVTYKSNTKTQQFAVFSEVYYNKGWNAYIDGQLTPYAKVNYVLRGMPIPSGQHEIVFKFEPKTHILGRTLSGIGNWLMLVLLALAAFSQWKNFKKTEA
jgi:hypothetical protein